MRPLITLLMLAQFGCLHVDWLIVKPPVIGQELPPKHRTTFLMIASGQMAPQDRIVGKDVDFDVALDDQNRIIFISTKAPFFRTPEGLSLGVTLEEVLAHGGSPVIYETGWAHYSVLPSGWCAAFVGPSYNKQPTQLLQPPQPKSKVDFYFKRKGLAT
jgi:hypothetical protein